MLNMNLHTFRIDENKGLNVKRYAERYIETKILLPLIIQRIINNGVIRYIA